MRAPRHRFSEEVRSATRTIASRMVAAGSGPPTPDELEAWLSRTPELKKTLERGGYGVEFTSEDLLPLLDVLIVKAGGAARQVDLPPRPRNHRLIVGVVILVALALMGIALATNVFGSTAKRHGPRVGLAAPGSDARAPSAWVPLLQYYHDERCIHS